MNQRNLFVRIAGLGVVAILLLGGALASAADEDPSTGNSPPDKSDKPDPLRIPDVATKELPEGEGSVQEAPVEKPAAVEPAKPAEAGSPQQSSRAMLAEFDVGAERLASLQDGQPLMADPGGEEILIRTLYRLPWIPLRLVEKWAQPKPDLAAVVKDPAAYRGDYLLVKGEAVRFEKVKLSADYKQRFNFNHYYRAEVLLGEQKQPAIVYTLELPRAWEAEKPLKEPVRLRGLFLKLGERAASTVEGEPEAEQPLPLVLLTHRIAWYPDSFLSDLGMDMGLFDTTKNKEPLRSDERECFYQLLNVVAEAGTHEMGRHASREVQILFDDLLAQQKKLEDQQAKIQDQESEAYRKVYRALVHLKERIKSAKRGNCELWPLFRKPKEHQGKLKTYEGTALRIKRIRVDDPDIIRRFGIDHYFQVDAMVTLEQTLKVPEFGSRKGLSDGTSKGKDIWAYPVTFCVRILPKGMPTGNKIREPIRIIGFHFKNWRFPTSEKSKAGRLLRTAPMLIGRELIWDNASASSGELYAVVAGGIFVTALCGIWLWVWRAGVGDKSFFEKTLAKQHAMLQQASLDQIGLEAEAEPDFRHLEEMDR